MDDSGIIFGFLVWIFLAWIIKTLIGAVKKTSRKMKTAGTGAAAVPKAGSQDSAPKEEEHFEAIPFRTESIPFAPRTNDYFGSLGVIANGPGSMGGESGEGKDPCHEEQSREMDLLEAEIASAEEGADVLPEFTAAGMAKAFVMSEILKRKHA